MVSLNNRPKNTKPSFLGGVGYVRNIPNPKNHNYNNRTDRIHETGRYFTYMKLVGGWIEPTHLKNMRVRQIGSFPKIIGMSKTKSWNHHLVYFPTWIYP